MRRPTLLAALLASCVLAIGPALSPAPAGADPTGERVSYRPPVDAPVSDPFRPPSERWKSGNRGLEYDTAPGTPVRAAADGEVVFAGPVAGSLHVTVLHADGLRTSYSFLESIAVQRGDRVVQGQIVGTAGERFHFGVRRGDTYLDPAELFDKGPPSVWLVPDERNRRSTEAGERNAIQRLIAAIGRPGAAAVSGADWARRHAVGATAQLGGAVRAGTVAAAAQARDQVVARLADARVQIAGRIEQLRGAARLATALNPCLEPLRLMSGLQRWAAQRGHCTPADVATPTLRERHRAVLVGGLGSSSEHAAVYGVPTARLGYAPADVSSFSYRGGTTAENRYAPNDTTVDIRRSGRRLRELLQRMEAEQPGVPVDVIAHSQGGLVVRSALGDEIDGADRRLPPLGAVVTLASPHKGADLATALAQTGRTSAGAAAQRALDRVTPVDLESTSLRQLSQTSTFLRRLNHRPLPAGVRFTSIGARGDLAVPASRTRLEGADNVTVSVPGALHDHDGLPKSEAAAREMALAVNDMPPTCQSLGDAMLDSVVPQHIAAVEDVAGAGMWLAGRAMSPRLPTAGLGGWRR